MAERKRRHPQRGVAARVWVHSLSLSLWSMAKGGVQERVVAAAALKGAVARGGGAVAW
jgi:hypothetical protein